MGMGNGTQVETTNTDTNTAVGGPGVGDTAPAPAVDAPAAPMYQGIGRTVNDAGEAVDYMKELERQNVEYRIAAERAAQPPVESTLTAPPVPAVQNGPTPEDLIFTKPKEALEMIEDRAVERIRRENFKKEQEKKFWDNFYDEAPDLKNADVVVKSVMNEGWHEISKKPLSEASKILADRSRKEVQKIRGTGGKETILPAGAASALGTTQGSAPKIPQAAPKSGSFVNQLKSFQRRGKR